MSRVTDVILTVSLLEEIGDSDTWPAVDSLNMWLREHRYGELREVSKSAGGTKVMQARVFMGAFNYLDIEKFIAEVQRTPFRDDEGIALFMKEEEQERFTDRTPNAS